MSINSVTSRIKEIQSQISMVKPSVSRRFSSVLNNETETKSDDKAQATDFTPLTPMQNDTGSSILQALVKKLSENNTPAAATDAFDPNCQECVAELAAKNGYVKAETQQQTQAATVPQAVNTQADAVKEIVLAAPAAETTAQTTDTVQTPVIAAQTADASQTTSTQSSVQTQNSAVQQTATAYTPLNPGVITLEDQKNMTAEQLSQRTGLNADYFALTAMPSIQPAQAAASQTVQNSAQTQAPATTTSAASAQAAASQTVQNSAQSQALTTVSGTTQNTTSQPAAISLPLGYTCPVDYSVTLPAEYQGAAQYMDIIKEASQRYGMPVNLIVGIMKAESDFDNSCVSYAGAKGLMQLMPETAAEVGVTDVFDPRQNILGSVEYITKLINKYGGDVRLALAGYNTGPGNIQREGVINSADQSYTNVPESIRDYADRVLDYAGYIKNTQ